MRSEQNKLVIVASCLPTVSASELRRIFFAVSVSTNTTPFCHRPAQILSATVQSEERTVSCTD